MESHHQRKTLTALSFALLLLFGLETVLTRSRGLIIGSAEILAEWFSVGILLSSYSPARTLPKLCQACLVSFFGFLGIADTFYVLFFYLLGFSPQSLFVISGTKLPYGIAFVSGACAPMLALKRPIREFFELRLSFLALMIALPIMVRFVADPYLSAIPSTHYSGFFLAGEAWDILTSGVLFFVGLLLFFHSRSLDWSLFACGVVTLVLGDWAIRHETLLGSPPSFGFYEFFWASGILLCITLVFPTTKHLPRIDTLCPTSWLNKFNIVGAIVSCSSIVLLCLIRTNDFDSIRILSLGVPLVMVSVAWAAHSLSEKVALFAQVTGGPVPLELVSLFESLAQHKTEISALRRRTEISGKAGHDIRSPLAALSTSLASVDLPAPVRTLSQNAFERIRAIADGLVSDERCTSSQPDKEGNLIFSLIQPLLVEKRAQYVDRSIRLSFQNSGEANQIRARCNAAELVRMLSNLTDNAFESIESQGEVTIELGTKLDKCWIRVHDTGKGIDPSVLPGLGRKGLTIGKVGGSGLGLYHARVSAESWGGSLEIESKLGHGTTVTVWMSLL